MATGMEAVIEIPMNRRSRGLLVDVADRISNDVRWTAGVTFKPWGCSALSVADGNFCDFEAAAQDNEVTNGTIPVFEVFQVYGVESCTTLDSKITDLNDRVRRRWEVQSSEQFAYRLNLELADAATVATTAPVNTSILIAAAEEQLALHLHGALGMVHMSPAVLSMVIAEGSVEFTDGQFRTPAGHVVIADAGHTGIQPDGEVLQADTEWVYTSGPVLIGIGDPRIPTEAVEYLDRAGNRNEARVVGYGIVAFDKCPVSAIEYGYPGFTEGS